MRINNVPKLLLISELSEGIDKLANLKTDKSSGPDGWPILALRETASQISTPLSIIFNKSLQQHAIPDIWKYGHITPIYKKGSRLLPSNYRPVSLISPIAKVMESIIKDNISSYMNTNNLFSQNQHGFTTKRSCTTQLLCAMNYWTQCLDDKYPVDVVYLDFQKAFDSVPHEYLLSKLHGYGIQGNLLSWIEAFLIGRKQRVVLNGHCSTWADVLSGVPQGSVLGPLLFNIYVNDIPDMVKSPILSFADDIKIFRSIKSYEDYTQLQLDLNYLSEWSSKWKLKFNVNKCNVLHLGTTEQYTYFLCGIAIQPTRSAKDLGVLIDQDLKFHEHASFATNKANRVLGLIKKSFSYLNSDMLVRLYKSMVRPILEYGNIIWGPHYLMDQKKVEKIQRRATKLITGLHDSNYATRLMELRLPSLNYRRQRGDMILLYQIFSHMVDIDINNFFVLSSGITRGHELKLYKCRSSCSLRSNFFLTV